MNVKNGSSRSCGCLRDEATAIRHRTHGLSRTREYKAWTQMKQRCLDPDNPGYHNYGGRGIGVHASWRDSFETFYATLGPRPSSLHSLERVNNDRDYEPGNVVWATRAQQNSNTRHNHLLTVDGETRTLSQWAHRAGIKPHALLHRIARGWSLAAAVSTGTVSDTKRSTNRYVTFRGETHCIAEWARRTGMQSVTIHARLRIGWSVERTLTEPVKLGRRPGPVARPYRRRVSL